MMTKNLEQFDLTEEKVLEKAPETPGIYKIHCSKPFTRLQEKTDIIYIGKASTLTERIMSVVTGQGRRNWYRFEALRKAGFELKFSFEKWSDDLRLKEKLELKKYEKKHLELPPLNHSR